MFNNIIILTALFNRCEKGNKLLSYTISVESDATVFDIL